MNKYIIWDWNGTLLSDVDAAVGALNRMLMKRGLKPTTRDYYRDHFGFPVRPFYAELGVDLAREDWDQICIDFHRFIAEEPNQHVREDARAALAQARAAGLGQSILSALREDILRRNVAAEGLAGFFDQIYGVDNLDGATKISRGHDLMKALPPAEFYCVGDTLHDAEVAAALGAKCVLVDDGHQTARRLATSGCPVVPTLEDAVAHIVAAPAAVCRAR